MYHSGLSVRDRDRIRQEILESLGWKGRIYRIWSADWFYNPLPEIAKLTAFLSECRAESRRREQEEPVLFPWEEDSDEEFAQPVAGAPPSQSRMRTSRRSRRRGRTRRKRPVGSVRRGR